MAMRTTFCENKAPVGVMEKSIRPASPAARDAEDGALCVQSAGTVRVSGKVPAALPALARVALTGMATPGAA